MLRCSDGPVLQSSNPPALATPPNKPLIGSPSASTSQDNTILDSIPFNPLYYAVRTDTPYIVVDSQSARFTHSLAHFRHRHPSPSPSRNSTAVLSSWTTLPTPNTQVPAVHDIPDRPPPLTWLNRFSLLSCHANVRHRSRLRPTTFPRSSFRLEPRGERRQDQIKIGNTALAPTFKRCDSLFFCTQEAYEFSTRLNGASAQTLCCRFGNQSFAAVSRLYRTRFFSLT